MHSNVFSIIKLFCGICSTSLLRLLVNIFIGFFFICSTLLSLFLLIYVFISLFLRSLRVRKEEMGIEREGVGVGKPTKKEC